MQGEPDHFMKIFIVHLKPKYIIFVKSLKIIEVKLILTVLHRQLPRLLPFF